METVLLALVVFQIKHFICDFLLQNSYQIRNKGVYLHTGGLIHAGLHALGSIPALLIVTQIPWVIAGLIAAEFVIHYHTDWAKARIDGSLRLNDTNTLYWAIFGSDQLIHQLTYIGMIYGVLRLA
ncbi:MAG TPA: DUF3307 domain-containing protein [Rhizomicrobium sp.]|nr:DUF3307 domain-containing protein [Rhizomicrobium sp.]